MSNSELLRIKNGQKTPYKSKRLQAVIKNKVKRPNDRLGFITNINSIFTLHETSIPPAPSS